MKKVIASLILVATGIVFSIGIMAQPPQPPAGQGTSGNQPRQECQEHPSTGV